MRHQLRIIPELKFFLDDTLDYLDHIDALLAETQPAQAAEANPSAEADNE